MEGVFDTINKVIKYATLIGVGLVSGVILLRLLYIAFLEPTSFCVANPVFHAMGITLGGLLTITAVPFLLYWIILGPHIIHEKRNEQKFLVHKKRMDWLKRRGWERDWYAVLGLDHTASSQEARKAYRHISDLCYPSTHSHSGNEEVMTTARDAYMNIRRLPTAQPAFAEERLLPVVKHPQN